MPVPIILIFAGLGLAAAAALVFWEKIVEWGHDAVFPWFHKYFPTYEKWVREAFVVINKVAGNIRKAAIEAWRRIRPILLEQVVEWERTSDNKYVCKVISWMVKNLQEKKIDQTVIIKEVDPDDLPLEIQEAFLRGASRHKWEVAKEQDRQVAEAEKELSLEY